MTKFYIAIIAFFFSAPVSAQFIHYYRNAPYESISSRVIMADDGYYTISNVQHDLTLEHVPHLMKMDQDGNLLWVKRIEIPNFTVADFLRQEDGSFILCGGMAAMVSMDFSAAVLVKLDADANMLWSVPVDSDDTNGFISLATDSDHIYVGGSHATYNNFAGTFNSKASISSWSQDGELLWWKSFSDGVSPSSYSYSQIMVSPGGKVVAAGTLSAASGKKFIITQFDAGGEVEWNKSMLIEGAFTISLQAMEEGNGQYWLAGQVSATSSAYDVDGVVFAFAPDGALASQHIINMGTDTGERIQGMEFAGGLLCLHMYLYAPFDPYDRGHVVVKLDEGMIDQVHAYKMPPATYNLGDGFAAGDSGEFVIAGTFYCEAEGYYFLFLLEGNPEGETSCDALDDGLSLTSADASYSAGDHAASSFSSPVTFDQTYSTAAVDGYLTLPYCEGCVAIGVEEDTSVDLHIFPNPASDLLNVSFAGSGNVSVAIMDQAGRIVFSEKCQGASLQIDTGFIADGWYVLQVMHEDEVLQRAFLISR